eukprot:COSAG01_NODE_5694_length_4092_cov_11.524418_2_plen_60_part_00
MVVPVHYDRCRVDMLGRTVTLEQLSAAIVLALVAIIVCYVALIRPAHAPAAPISQHIDV